MGLEALLGVWLRAPVDGARLLVLMALANFADSDRIAAVKIAVLGQRARLGDRRTQQVLAELEEKGLIERLGGGGRGISGRYRILVEMDEQTFTISRRRRVNASAPFDGKKGEADYTVTAAKTTQEPSPFSPLNGARSFAVSGETMKDRAPFSGNGEEDCTLSRPKTVNEASPFEVPPCIPPIGNTSPSSSTEVVSSSSASGRPLTVQQELVQQVGALFSAAGLKPPSPGQTGAWAKLLAPRGGEGGGLVDLIEDLVGRDLAGKSNPTAYVHACVKARAEGRDHPGRALPLTLAAGGDSARSRQASEISERSRRRALGGDA